MTDQLQLAPRPTLWRDESTCQVYLVRHGTTTMNVENRYRGRRDIPLDAQGYQDAVDAARQLSGVGVTCGWLLPRDPAWPIRSGHRAAWR